MNIFDGMGREEKKRLKYGFFVGLFIGLMIAGVLAGVMVPN